METLDLRGLKCPLPALFAKRALERAGEGAEIEIVTDDPMAPIDVPHMCRNEGFEFVSVTRDGDQARMVLRRLKTSAAAATGPGD
jgi:tRNA 2-thiouridine synthesizing protein A